jgi:hypothetical protein
MPEALKIQFDESYSFLDREIGQVETVSRDLLREAEEPIEVRRHEWAIMEEFSQSVESDGIRQDLLHAIQIALDWCEEHQIVWE